MANIDSQLLQQVEYLMQDDKSLPVLEMLVKTHAMDAAFLRKVKYVKMNTNLEMDKFIQALIAEKTTVANTSSNPAEVELNELNAGGRVFKDDFKYLVKEIARLEKEVKGHHNHIEALLAYVNGLEGENQTLKADVELLTTTLKTRNTELEDLSEEKALLEQKNKELARENRKLTLDVQSINGIFKKENDDLRLDIEKMAAEITRLTTENKKLAGNQSVAKNNVRAENMWSVEDTDENKPLREEITRLTTENKVLTKENQTINYDFKQLVEKAYELTTENNSLKEKNEIVKQERDELANSVDKLKDKYFYNVETLKEKIAKLEEESSTGESSSITVDKLSKEIEELTRERYFLKVKLGETEEKLKQSEETHLNTYAETLNILNEIKMLQTDAYKITKPISKVLSDPSKLTNEYLNKIVMPIWSCAPTALFEKILAVDHFEISNEVMVRMNKSFVHIVNKHIKLSKQNTAILLASYMKNNRELSIKTMNIYCKAVGFEGFAEIITKYYTDVANEKIAELK